ncbi:MAG: TRAP transporter small permease [Rhodobacterales bacterium]|nr:TRAP transporter small permease [Rhodobacterales bacterium]MDX5500293.1 TRAP transporter small permease [Rhodobacterales bacterium]
MKLLFDLTGRASQLLAVIARLLIGALVLLVVSDVAVRNLGMRPLGWAVNTSEFFLLYITFLSMPWLIRSKGHVFVEFLRIALPASAKKVLARIVYLGCMALCLYLGWVALNSLTLAVQRGTYEMRTFDIPKWVVFTPMVVAFFLSALEWLRFAMGYDDMYERDLMEVGGH